MDDRRPFQARWIVGQTEVNFIRTGTVRRGVQEFGRPGDTDPTEHSAGVQAAAGVRSRTGHGHRVAFGPDGTRLAVGCKDNTIRL